MLDVPRLRLLRAVVATGSVRAAAETLGYTPSAVSQQLAALQRETGLRLLDRAGRGIEPTTAGRTLATEAEPLFEALTRLEGLVGDLRAGRVGSLSIGYFASAGAAWLPPVVAALHAEFPELRLDLRMTEMRLPDSRPRGPNPQRVPQGNRGMPDSYEPDVDIFVERPEWTPPAGADVRHLVDDPYLAVVRTDDPLAGRGEVPLAELAGRRWIDNDVNDGACRRVLLRACAEAGFSPEFAVETHDYHTAIPFVATGIGLTVVPELGIRDLPPDVTTVRIVAPEPVRRIHVAVRKSAAQHPAAQRAADLLREVVGGAAVPRQD
ncbi:LysR family transcriptional regulator [Jiangella rhizosphaerae]|uniref:LysR family transcriptional regulator n=1 Tax=Jiangella rhizosphaerae TaxID=2293569 RepID=A0A418KNX0_9ACTN|nr:LysR family transcriptional regulator [Jiangella rhizosphaerae]RIQ20813.1 LysR family transcriptional regulator [Jiangella rhizosphaerae]